MSHSTLGTIGWIDLTVANADAVCDFYRDVVGWEKSPVPMGDYHDYVVRPPGTTDPVAGICHARGENTELPPQWLMYISIADLEASLTRCRELGGAVISGPRDVGAFGRMAVIRDPAGAVAALIEPPPVD